MKRAPFIGAAAASLLAGCGGNHVMRALPGVAPSNGTVNPPSSLSNVKLVPSAAEAIPQNVLANPFIGEARRFDDKSAPAGWVFAQGQAISAADNPRLLSILGRRQGDKSTTTFNLPNPGFGVIVAVAGVFPTSPSLVAASGRHMTHLDSLGPNAIPRGPKMLKPPSEKLLADRRLMMSGPRVGRGSPTPVTAELSGRIDSAVQDARAAAIEALSSQNRARLASAVQAAVGGGSTVFGAVSAMRSALTNSEADALLQVNDAMNRPFGGRDDSSRPREYRVLDAASFLVSVAITREQARAIFARERRAL